MSETTRDLAEAWAGACSKLWEMTESTEWINRNDLTLWDAFKLLYLGNIGHKTINPDILVDSRIKWEGERNRRRQKCIQKDQT